jgi:hypothetical protein
MGPETFRRIPGEMRNLRCVRSLERNAAAFGGKVDNELDIFTSMYGEM